MTIRFSEDEVRPMGRAASGVRGMKLKAGDQVVSCDLAKDDTSILMITERGFGKRVQLDKFNVQGRGGQGVKGIKFIRNKGVAVVAAFMVGDEDEIVAVASDGQTIRTPVHGIRHIGRDATGVSIMNLAEGQTVASVALILATDDD
jgi:DNA gyrase subunit A